MSKSKVRTPADTSALAFVKSSLKKRQLAASLDALPLAFLMATFEISNPDDSNPMPAK
jgi:hypothetical protein